MFYIKTTFRILSLFLSVLLLFSFILPCLAADDADITGQTDNVSEYMYEEMARADKDLIAEYSGKTPESYAFSRINEIILPEPGTYMEGHLLIKVESGIELQGASSLTDGIAESSEFLFSVSEDGGISLMGDDTSVASWFLINVAGGITLEDAWAILLKNPRILTVEPNYVVHMDNIDKIDVYDPYEHAQDWLDEINAPEVWDELSSEGKAPGEGVVIAVIDSGIDLDHPDLDGNLWSDNYGNHGHDFIDDDNTPDDLSGHGTHVAGIIAAERNDTGVSGVAYASKLMAVRVLDDEGRGSRADIIRGIAYAVENGAEIINLSIGGFGYSQAYADAVKAAVSSDILVAASAGNNALPTAYAGDSYYGVSCCPAGLSGVLTAMAMSNEPNGRGDWLASFSNYDADPGEGSEYEVMAPGTSILSTDIDGIYAYKSGTSMASPVTAGAAAVLMGAGATREQAWNCIVNSGVIRQGRTQPDKTVRSYHTLNLQAAYTALKANTAYLPIITNCSLSAECRSVTINKTTVELNNLNTSSLVYFQDGSFLSSINLSLENLGASSGHITITGTVGGAAIKPYEISSVTNSEIKTITLSLSETPAKSASVSVNLTVTPTDARSNLLAPVYVNRIFTAYDFTLPEGIVYDGYKYILEYPSVTVGGAMGDVPELILCLPKDLYIASGQTLTFLYGIIYEESGVKIETASGGSVIFGAASLLGNGSFKYVFDGVSSNGQNADYPESIAFYSCIIYEPNLQNVKYLSSVKVYGSTLDRGTPKIINAYSISTSGFYDLYNTDISCTAFYGNLVNNCVDVTLTGEFLFYNSFVDNGSYLSGEDIQQLIVYTSDYSYENWVGFLFNCVVGPIKVYKPGTTDPAVISDVYYQPVNAQADFGNEETYNVLPVGTADTLTCAAGSYVYTDISRLYSSGYNWCCPAFVTSADLTQCSTDGYKISYTLQYIFSTGIYYGKGYPLYCNSPTDAFMSGSDISGNTQFDNSMIAKINGSTAFTDLEKTEYYELSGYYTQDYTFSNGSKYTYWATSIKHQSLYRFPINLNFYSNWLDINITPGTDGYPVLSWSGEAYKSGYYGAVYRRIKGQTEETPLGNIGTVLTYTDTDISPGNKYTYIIRVFDQNGNKILEGSCDYAANGTDTALLTDAASNSQALSMLTISVNEPIGFKFLKLTVNYNEDTLNADSIAFSDSVKNSGVPYGARKIDYGSFEIYIGQPGGEYIALDKGALFNIPVTNSDITASESISIGSVTLDCSPAEIQGSCCTYELLQGSSKLIYDNTAGFISVWLQQDSNDIYVSLYNTEGKMLGVKAAEKELNNNITAFTAAYESVSAMSVFYIGAEGKPVSSCVRLSVPSPAK